MNVSLGIYEKAFPEDLELCEMLKIAKEVGYDFFEISIDRTDKRIDRVYNANTINSVLEAIEIADFPIEHIGLSALAVYTLGNIDETIRNKGKDIFYNTVLFAKKLGCRIIQIPAYDMPKFENNNDETHNLYLSNLREMIEVASKEGVMIALENMENDYADNVEKCMNIINSIKSPYLQLYPDSGNLTVSAKQHNYSIYEDMNKGLGKYLAFHLKEARENKYGGLYYGEGAVDFPNIVKYAYGLGARRFAMEYWYTGSIYWKEDLMKAKDLFYSWLENK